MLDEAARSLIAEQFSVYDHEWRYLTCHIGEPFLIDGLLVFDDGAVLSLCAFDLSELGRTVSVDRVQDALSSLYDQTRHRLVHIWGCFDVIGALDLGSQRFSLTDPAAASDEYPGEFTVDLLGETPKVASLRRKMLRKLERQGVTVEISPSEPLGALELHLIEVWRNGHELVPLGISAGQAIASFVRERASFTARVYVEGRLAGFSVFTQPNDQACANLMSFSERISGKRLDDAGLIASLDYGRALGSRRFHLGYAGSESLAAFKRKWGGRETGPRYKDAIYTADSRWSDLADSYGFAWISRLTGPAFVEPRI